MKTNISFLRSISRCALAAALVLAPAAVSAAVLQTNLSDADQLKYTNDVSSSDLLNGLTATVVTGWDGSNGASTQQINDGVHGVGGVPVKGAWSIPNSTITFDLGVGTGLGYDLTSILSIASWDGDGFGNQAYNIEVQLVGAVVFSALASVNNTPFGPTGLGSTKTTLTDDTGTLASGVQLIRFNIGTSTSTGGKSVFREIDVQGIATVPEPASFGLLALGALSLLRRRRA